MKMSWPRSTLKVYSKTKVHFLIPSNSFISGWTLYAFKLVFATYLTLSIIVLINLLIAMMSDTYCRIQEQSDIGEYNTFSLSE